MNYEPQKNKILPEKLTNVFFRFRHRKDDDDKMSGGAACCLTFLVLIAQIFLHGVVGLVLFELVVQLLQEVLGLLPEPEHVGPGHPRDRLGRTRVGRVDQVAAEAIRDAEF